MVWHNARGFSDISILEQLSYDKIIRRRAPHALTAVPGLRPIVTRQELTESRRAEVLEKRALAI